MAAVIVTGAAVFLLSLATTMSIFVTNIASMLGIGVAVDYSLFVLSRYRDELARGAGRDEALDIAMRTSGAAVVFSGTAVVVSLGGIPELRGIRRGADVVRARALGAKACMIGRAWLYGLASEGQSGVERALQILHDEIDVTLTLLGHPKFSDVGPETLQVRR